MVAVIQSRGVAAKQGFLMYYTKGVAIGTDISVRYRESGCLSVAYRYEGCMVIFCAVCTRPPGDEATPVDLWTS